ncbi:MAG: hypothetical protein ABI165_21925 [Bryobacteraceae bacterium]
MASLITGLVSGVISSALTYFGTRSKIRLDMRVEYDKNLHDKRLELYKQLWPKTEPLARFAPHYVLNYNMVKAVSVDMREWYFKEGGIYLSKRSRKPYFALKKQMQHVIDNGGLETRPDAQIDDGARDAILEAASNLRTSLADDIRTRNAPWL